MADLSFLGRFCNRVIPIQCYVQQVEEKRVFLSDKDAPPLNHCNPCEMPPIPLYQLHHSQALPKNPLKKPHSSKSHRLLNLRNRLPRIQPLRTRPRTVQYGMAPVQTHAVVQHLLPLGLVLVAGVGEPAVRLQQDGRAEVFFAVPPVGRAGGRAAGAEDAFVEPVELLAVCR